MAHINIEFKAKAKDITNLENKLSELHPLFIGEDHQIDTYYNVVTGRLKLREGNIENALIYYERKDIATQKQSDVILYKHAPDENLKTILTKTYGIKVFVKKKRKIYFVDNVKIHFDDVEGLGTFIEVEAIETDTVKDVDALEKQCNDFSIFFDIQDTDYEKFSYADLLLNQNIT